MLEGHVAHPSTREDVGGHFGAEQAQIPTVLIAVGVDRIAAGRAQLVCDAWSA
jgi:hypothetical protein